MRFVFLCLFLLAASPLFADVGLSDNSGHQARKANLQAVGMPVFAAFSELMRGDDALLKPASMADVYGFYQRLGIDDPMFAHIRFMDKDGIPDRNRVYPTAELPPASILPVGTRLMVSFYVGCEMLATTYEAKAGSADGSYWQAELMSVAETTVCERAP